MTFKILLESGDALLLEDGFFLELEHTEDSVFTLVEARAGKPRWILTASEPRWVAEPSERRWKLRGHRV